MKEVFSLTREVFSLMKEVFSLMKEVFSLAKEVFSLTREVFSFIREVLSLTKEIFSLVCEKISFIGKSSKFSFMNDKNAKIYNLLGADGKFYQSETKGLFGGHRKDKIYGTLDCKGAARWIAKGFYIKQRVFFADEETAIAAGYRPCYECLREKYNEWKAK